MRFELTTPCSGGMYSIHLSYGRVTTEYSTSETFRAFTGMRLWRLEARVGFEPTNGGFADLSLGPLGYRAGFSSIANLNSQPAIRRKLEIAPPGRSFGKPILNRREFPSVLRGETKRGRADGREICGQAPRLRWSAEVEADFVRLMIVSRQYGGMGTSVSASAFREGRVI